MKNEDEALIQEMNHRKREKHNSVYRGEIYTVTTRKLQEGDSKKIVLRKQGVVDGVYPHGVLMRFKYYRRFFNWWEFSRTIIKKETVEI